MELDIKNKKVKKYKKKYYHVTWDADAAEKGGFEDFMIKEIHEQPKAIKRYFSL